MFLAVVGGVMAAVFWLAVGVIPGNNDNNNNFGGPAFPIAEPAFFEGDVVDFAVPVPPPDLVPTPTPMPPPTAAPSLPTPEPTPSG